MNNRSDASAVWLVAVMIPVCSDLSWTAAVAWAGTLLVGSVFGEQRPFHWVGAGWVAHVLVPGVPLAGAAAAGSMIPAWRLCLAAAAVGVTLSLTVPVSCCSPGILLMVAGIGLAIQRRMT